jgi:predicted thioesterase
MKKVFKTGERYILKVIAQKKDVADHGEMTQPVYATFALVRDVENAAYQFALQKCEQHEGPVFQFLSVDHTGIAYINDEVTITVWVDHFIHTELTCFFEASVHDQLIAVGKTGMKILMKKRVEKPEMQP